MASTSFFLLIIIITINFISHYMTVDLHYSALKASKLTIICELTRQRPTTTLCTEPTW